MAMKNPAKISFCTTCKGRLHHLKETLPQNLKNAAEYPDVEFVILDYDSQDGLGEWIKQNYQTEIDSGKIRYARVENKPHFHMSHAKNMAHRAATGDILCNLDADNIIAPGFASWLNTQFTKDPNIYLRIDSPPSRRFRRNKDYVPGKEGRIALRREDFMYLHGYDEQQYKGWGGEDTNLDERAALVELKRIQIPREMEGGVIKHSDEERVKRFEEQDRAVSAEKLRAHHSLPRRILKHLRGFNTETDTPPPPAANPHGNFGCGTVTINFKDEVTFDRHVKPVRVRESQAQPSAGSGKRFTTRINEEDRSRDNTRI